MTVDPKIEYKFKYYWGGEENWYTKSKRWANEQKFPLNHLALGFVEFLWRLWVQGKVDMEMTSVDKQVNEIIKTWEDQENTKPTITSEPSEVEGLDDIRIKTSYSGDGDWNDASINHKKWDK